MIARRLLSAVAPCHVSPQHRDLLAVGSDAFNLIYAFFLLPSIPLLGALTSSQERLHLHAGSIYFAFFFSLPAAFMISWQTASLLCLASCQLIQLTRSHLFLSKSIYLSLCSQYQFYIFRLFSLSFH